MNTPWICPRCQRVNAPHADQCTCVPDIRVSKLKEALSSIKRGGPEMNPNELPTKDAIQKCQEETREFIEKLSDAQDQTKKSSLHFP